LEAGDEDLVFTRGCQRAIGAGISKLSSFLSQAELRDIGFLQVGANCSISRYARFYGSARMRLGNNVRIDDFSIVSGTVVLGNHVHIAGHCALYAGGEDASITMGDFSGASGRVSIYARSDDYSGNWMTNPTVPEALTRPISRSVVIGRHAIIGTGSVVLPGVTLEEGAALGAMSLANRTLPSFTIHSGVPAKFLKVRRRQLLDLEKEIDFHD
jgi:dTDP-4-amino-4,6-dideoxy-D-glucose acyltransferase